MMMAMRPDKARFFGIAIRIGSSSCSTSIPSTSLGKTLLTD